jgi:nucleotide-binding universal stress UspA family protein
MSTTPAFGQILVATDFSEPSRKALAVAADLARHYGSKITIAHVYPVPGYVLPEGFIAAGPDVLVEVENRTRKTLEEWQADAVKMGVADVSITTAIGNAAPEIVRIAKAGGFGLIVVGTHGRTGFTGFVLGSVASKVVTTSDCPVVTVPFRE